MCVDATERWERKSFTLSLLVISINAAVSLQKEREGAGQGHCGG